LSILIEYSMNERMSGCGWNHKVEYSPGCG